MYASRIPASDEPGQGWADQERVRRWIAGADRREAQMAPISDELFAAAALRPGEAVLDVGCGTGPTTVRAAEAVGADGRVLGTDVAEGMIDTARTLGDRPGIEWLVADAQTHEFGAASFDVVISRFGVMFFPDPVAAFANLARATRPGGRLVVAVWQTRDRAPLFDLPYRAAARVLDRLGLAYAPVPVDDSQCSLGSADRVAAVLGPAGWRDVETRPTGRTVHLGGALTPEAAAEQAVELGPVRGLLEGRPADVVDAVRAELLPEFRDRYDGTGVAVPGGYLVVTARR